MLSTSGDPNLNGSAILELIATDKGILIPRMTSGERNAITVGASQNGLLIFNTSSDQFEYYEHSSTSWRPISEGVEGSGDTGQIAFWTNGASSSTITGDAGLFYDSSNTFLGIGTSTPTSALDVAGDVNTSGSLTVVDITASGDVNSSGNISAVDMTASGNITSSSVTTDGVYISDGSGNNLVFEAPAGMTGDVNVTFPADDGDAGEYLTTDGNGNLGWSDIGSSTFDASSIIINNGTDGGLMYNNSGTLSNTDILTLDASNSFFGINNSNPVYPLDVAGFIRSGEANQTDGGLLMEDSNTGFTSYVLPNPAATASVTFTLPANNGGNGSYLTTDGAGNLVWVDPGSQQDFVIDISTSDPSNQVSVFGGSNSITGSDIYYDASSSFLGIGTATPSSALDVASGTITTGSNGVPGGIIINDGSNNNLNLLAPNGMTGDIDLTLPNDDGNAGQFLTTDGDGNLTWGDAITGTVNSSNVSFGEGIDGGVAYRNSGTLTASDAIYIDASNTYLGVGTTSPDYTLDVAGFIRSGEAGQTDGGLLLEDSNTGFTSYVLPNPAATASVTFTLPANNGGNGSYLTTDGAGNLVWVDPGSQQDFVIDISTSDPSNQVSVFGGSNSITGSDIYYDASNSFLGIGTATPGSALDVAGDANITENVTSSSISTDGVYISDGSGNNLVFEAPAGMTGDVNVTFPANDGNAGEYLTTDGNGNLSFASATIGPDGVNLGNNGNGGILFNNSGTLTSSDVLTLDNSNSFFGVNQSNPQYPLDVAGFIRSGEAGQTDGGLLLEDSNTGFTSYVLPNPAATASVTFTLPANNGGNGSYLTTDGAGNLVWVDPGSQQDFVIDISTSDPSNQVSVFGGSNSITGSDIYYDASNSFLGIGTATPGSALDVAGDVTSSGSLTVVDVTASGDVASSGNISAVDMTASGNITSSSISTDGVYISDGSGNNLVFEAPAGMTGDVNVTFPANDGNAGEYLTTDGNGNLSFASATIGPDGVNLGNNGNGGILYNNSGTLTSSDVLTLDNSNSFFGVNNSNPQYPLDVAGFIRSGEAGQTDGGLLLEDSNTGFTSYVLPNPAATASVTFTLPANNGGNGSYLTTDGAGNLVWVDPGSQQDFVIDISTSDPSNQVSVFGGSNSITGSDIYYDASNSFLGIGTATPGSALDVAGDVTSSGSLTVVDVTASGDVASSGNISAVDMTASGNITSSSISTDGVYISDGSGNNLVFEAPAGMTGDVNVTFPANDGNAGEYLTTDGNGNLSFASATIGPDGVNLGNNGNGGILYNNSGTLTSSDVLTLDNSNSFFGVNQSNPQYPLDVAGFIRSGEAGQTDGGLLLEDSNTGFTSYVLPNPAATASVTFTLPANNGGNGSYLTTDGAGNLVWVDPGSQQDFVIDISTSDPSNQVSVFGGSNSITGSDIYYDASNSFLGIGTSTPTTPLDVAGTINTSGSVTAVDVTASGDISATNINASGDMSATNITASGNVSSSSVTTDGVYISDGSGNNLVFEAPAGMTGDVNVTFPANDGNAGEYLTTDGNGNLSFASATIGPDGVNLGNNGNGGILYNNSGTLTSSDVLTLDNSNSFFGVNQSNPQYPLDVAGFIRSGEAGQTDGGLLLEDSNTGFTSYVLPNPAATASVTFTLPANNGGNGSYLTTDGAGNLVWVDPGSQQDFVIDISTSDPSNQVSVFGGSNSITGSDIYYDASNSFLGIGTATPGSALDVAGDVTSSGSLTVVDVTASGDVASSGNISAVDMTASGNITSSSISTDGVYISDGSGNNLVFEAPAGMTGDVNVTFPANDGNAGEYLTTDGNGNLSFASATIGPDGVNLGNNGNGGILYNNSGTLTSSDVLTLDNSNSFFGVNNSNPQYPLDVAGFIRSGEAGQTDGGLLLEDSNTGFTSYVLPNPAATASVTFTLPANNGGNGSYLTTDGAGNLVWVDPGSQQDFVIDISTSDPSNQVSVFGGSNSITGSDIYYDASNSFLGIGTSTPGSALDVAGDVTSSGSLTVVDVTASGDVASSGNISAVDMTASGNITSSSISTDGVYISDGSGNNLVFEAPAGMTGDVNVTFPANDGNAGEYLTTDGNGNLSFASATIGPDGVNLGNNGNGGILFNNSGTLTSSDVLTLDNSNSFFGVNQSNPQYPIDVAGFIRSGEAGQTDGGLLLEDSNTGFTSYVLPNPAATASVTFTLPANNGGNGSYLTTDGAGNLVWVDPGSQQDFVIDISTSDPSNQVSVFGGSNSITGSDIYYDASNSFLGIGTATPGSALDVAGDVTSSGSLTVVDVTASGDVASSGNISAVDMTASGNITSSSISTDGVYISDGSGNNLVFEAPAGMTGDVNFTLPSNQGSSGQVLSTDGNGALSWIDGGSSTFDASNILINNGTDGGLMYNNSGTLSNTDVLTLDNSNSFFGVNQSNPQYPLDVAGFIRSGEANQTDGGLLLEDSNTGFTSYVLPNPAATASVSMTLPPDNGSNGQILGTDGSGNLTWINPSSGNVDGSGVVNQLAFWETSSTLTSDAGLFYNPSNTYLGIGTESPSSALDVASGTITTGSNGTPGSIILQSGNGNNGIQLTAPGGMSSSTSLTLPSDDGNAGEVLTTDGDGNLSWESAGSTVEYATNSPTAYNANQNNVSLDLDNTVFRLSSNTNVNFTGINATGVSTGKMVILVNVGSFDIRIRNEDSNSSGPNRILTASGTIVLKTDGSVTLIYDGVTQRWRVIASN